jgi:hypothetical protein
MYGSRAQSSNPQPAKNASSTTVVAQSVVPPPAELAEHIYEHYLPPPEGGYEPLGSGAEEDGGGLERLDPVCLMDDDPYLLTPDSLRCVPTRSAALSAIE